MARISPEAREEVRRKLLSAAAAHFARHGLDRARVDTIAEEAGFAKGTIYNYFRSKEELFGAVLTEACRRTVSRYAAAPHGRGARAELEALVRADVSVLREEEGFIKVLVREALSAKPETYPLILAHLAPFHAQVQAILSRGAERGQVRRDRPVAELALLFVGILALLYVQYWGSGGTWPSLEELPKLAVSVFLDGAAAKGTPARAKARRRPAPGRRIGR